MSPDKCIVAVEIAEHHVTIHFKSGELFKIYVHPDNVVLLTGDKRAWARKSGLECTLNKNEYRVRALMEDMSSTFKQERDDGKTCSVNKVMAEILEQIGMEVTMASRIRNWVEKTYQA